MAELSVKEICEIIKTGSKSGLAELEYLGLKVKFRTDVEHDPASPGESGLRLTKNQAQLLTQENESANLSDNEAKTREEQLSFLRLADPEAYEELIARGELENAREKSEGLSS